MKATTSLQICTSLLITGYLKLSSYPTKCGWVLGKSAPGGNLSRDTSLRLHILVRYATCIIPQAGPPTQRTAGWGKVRATVCERMCDQKIKNSGHLSLCQRREKARRNKERSLYLWRNTARRIKEQHYKKFKDSIQRRHNSMWSKANTCSADQSTARWASRVWNGSAQVR